jgi:transcriptional regulator with XRE-family HTH domain
VCLAAEEGGPGLAIALGRGLDPVGVEDFPDCGGGYLDPQGGQLDGAAAMAAVLDMVGPRLRRVREQRGLTLTEAAEQTGISKSTLSRLENGQRRPSLELLLPLAQMYQVPIDDLAGAPEVGDPRIRLKPRRVNGRTVLPLTRPGGVQVWKIVVPASQSTPNPRTHDGFEWLYVLSGRLRLVLGDQDLVLGVGEAAGFDTQVPHWFGSTGDGPAEVLSIFGHPGERMLVRASDGGTESEQSTPRSSPSCCEMTLPQPAEQGGDRVQAHAAVDSPGWPGCGAAGAR